MTKKKTADKQKEEEIIGLSEEKFKKLELSETDLEAEEEELHQKLRDAYFNIQELLKTYCDLKEDDYNIIALWIIGTYFHEQFETYPFLFLNAMKGSGKTRTLKLITKLSKDGEVQASLTEAVLFRTKGTLGLDEFEGITRRGSENLRELLNTAYKKGTRIKRVKQIKTPEGTQYGIEEFDVYRPIVMANIWGMEEVLGDRCYYVILERSNNARITKLMEIYENEEIFQKTKELLFSVVKCSVVTVGNVYKAWNLYVKSHNIDDIYITTLTRNYTKLHKLKSIFRKLYETQIDGRSLEITFPLLIIAMEIGDDIVEKTLKIIEEYAKKRRDEQFVESRDVSLIDFISQKVDDGNWIRISELTREFKEFIQSNDEFINSKWMGRALKRLNLIKNKKRMSGGIHVILDIPKAQKNILMFKDEK